MRNKGAFFAAMGIAGGIALSAAGATYNASTGYVTLSNAGSGQRQSPLSTTAAIDTGNNQYFWSDQLPIHAGTNYYLNVSVRGILMTDTSQTNHYEFLGNRMVMGPSCAISWKSFSPSTYTFLNEGAIVQGGCIWKVNEAVARPAIVRGRVEVTDSASNPFKLIPWGAESHYMEGLTLSLETEVIGDANQRMQVVANTSATFPRRGIVSLAGDMSQFLGTVEVASNRLFVCNETLSNAKLVTVTKCGDLFTEAAGGGTGAVSKVTVDATSSFGAAAGNTLVISDLTLADGAALRFGWNGTVGCVEVTNSFVAAGTIGVAPDAALDATTFTNGPARVAVLKVKGTDAFTLDRFTRVPPIAWFGARTLPADLPRMTLEVANEDGWTVLYVTLDEIVLQIVNIYSGTMASLFHQADSWSNGKIPADNEGRDFYTGSYATYLSSYNNADPYHFPGRSLTLGNTITIWQNKTYEFDELNLLAGTTMQCWMGACTLAGNIRLHGTGTYRIIHGNRTPQTWSASLSGNTDILVTIRVPSEKEEGLGVSSFKPTGINTNYTGKWTVEYIATSANKANPTQYMVFAACESRNLGAPFKTFQYDALTIRNWQALKAGQAYSLLDDVTRGIHLEGNAQLLADGGQTLALKCPLTFSGVARKSGAGTLGLGGDAKPKFCGAAQSSTPLAGTNGLVVAGGWIQPFSTNGVDGLAVTFAGGGIRLHGVPSDAGARQYGFWNTKWSVPFARAEGWTDKVPVMIDMSGQSDMPSPVSRYAICTVAAGQADAVKELFAVRAPFKGYVTDVEKRANADGTVTLLAVVKYGGTTIIFR